MKYIVEIWGNFEKGDCGKCPLSYLDEDFYGDVIDRCVLGGLSCPLKETK